MPILPVWFDDPLEDYSPIGQWFDEQFDATASPTSYTLPADVGSFALTGNSATTLHNILIEAGTGAFALSSNGATLALTRNLDAATGSFALVGQPADLPHAGESIQPFSR